MSAKLTKAKMKEELAARYAYRTVTPSDVSAQDMADLAVFLNSHPGAAKIFTAVNQDVHNRVATIRKANGRRLHAENEAQRIQSKLNKAIAALSKMMAVVDRYKEDCCQNWKNLQDNLFALEKSEILNFAKLMAEKYSDHRQHNQTA